ncbi:MAG: hypothetical protein ACKO3L_00390 [Actinomycetota bacterium]
MTTAGMNNTTFVNAANLLGAVAGRFGLFAPGFRTPPRIVGVQRTVRRRPGGGVVAVAVKNRPVAAVLADMIDGVIVVNDITPPESDTVRAALWSAVTPLLASTVAAGQTVANVSRVA